MAKSSFYYEDGDLEDIGDIAEYKADTLAARDATVGYRNEAQAAAEAAQDALEQMGDDSAEAAASAAAAAASQSAAATSATAAAGSATSASSSATSASSSATSAASSASSASTANTNAQAAKTAAEAAYDSFDDRWLGPKASDPTTDNDGNTLLIGAAYFNTSTGLKMWDGAAWNAYSPTAGVPSVFGRTGSVVAVNGDYNAGQVTNTPTGNIAATTVQAALDELDTEKQAVSAKGQPNGYASLDGSGLIPSAQIPAIAISDTFTVSSQAAMLALSSADKGDIAIRTDLNKSFILSTSSYGTLSDWKELLTPTDSVQSVAGLTGTISGSGLSTAMGLGTISTKAATSGTGIQKGDGSGGLTSATAGTDYQAADAQLFSNIPQNSQSAAYTFVLTDGQKEIFHPAADTTARTWTIPANASVAYPIGTVIALTGETSSGVITLQITTDTLVWLPGGSTGSRTLTSPFAAAIKKITSTKWHLVGTGIT